MMRIIALSSSLLVLGLVGCKGEQTTEAAPTTPVAPTAAAPSETPPTPAAPAVSEQAYVTVVTGLKREASDAKSIDDPKGKSKKKISNWLMTLYRGEEVTILEVQEEYAKVKASDDSEGWVQKTALLPVEGVALATVFEEAKTFSRPDLLALNSTKLLEPGSLLFVLKTKDQFTEVNHYGQASTWLLSEKLNTDSREIAAAKLLAKVRWLKSKNDPSADTVMELAKTQFGDSRLVGMANPDASIGAPADAPAPDNQPATPPPGTEDSAP